MKGVIICGYGSRDCPISQQKLQVDLFWLTQPHKHQVKVSPPPFQIPWSGRFTGGWGISQGGLPLLLSPRPRNPEQTVQIPKMNLKWDRDASFNDLCWPWIQIRLDIRAPLSGVSGLPPALKLPGGRARIIGLLIALEALVYCARPEDPAACFN